MLEMGSEKLNIFLVLFLVGSDERPYIHTYLHHNTIRMLDMREILVRVKSKTQARKLVLRL